MQPLDRSEIRRLAAWLATADAGSEQLDRALLAALGWRPQPAGDGVCWLSWGEDPSGATVWLGSEPRPTRRVEDARRLHDALFAGHDRAAGPPAADALAICRAIVARLAARG